jgi:hypothetical protein
VRARRAAFGGYSLLLCAGLAFIFVAPHEGRSPGAPPSPGLDVASAQAMTSPPRRSIALPTDRVMSAPAEILGRQQAPDVWSTPLQAEAPATDVVADIPTAEIVAEAPAPDIGAMIAVATDLPGPVVIEHTSLVDRPLAADEKRLSAAPTTTSAVPPPSLRTLAGKWAPHPAACAGSKRSAFLPLTINERGARAGTSSCSFKRTAQNGNRWVVSATCTDAAVTWNANVRLVLAGSKLTWSSERGAQTYTRCR